MYQPLYGYGQSSRQPQEQQKLSTQQYVHKQQKYSTDSNNKRNQSSLPNFNAYMSSQEHHSNTNSPTIPHETSVDKIGSPHLSYKSKVEFQQQYAYNSPMRHVTPAQQIKSTTQINIHPNGFDNTPGYRYMNSSPATSPIQQQHTLNENSHGGFSSQDIVAGFTQPITATTTSTTNDNTPIRIVNNNELPTLPPLSTSPQSSINTTNRSRAKWMSDEERHLVSGNTLIPSSSQPDPSVLIEYHKPHPSVLVQYHTMSNNRNDRRLMSAPYPHSQQPRQDTLTNTSTPYTDIGPYGCGAMDCFASFSASSSLFTHMKEVHKYATDIYKPYRCAMPACSKRYKNINGLQYHLRNAKGSSGHGNVIANENDSKIKPYQCQISGCKKTYRTPNGLRYHHQHGHTEDPPLQHIVNALQEQQYQLRLQQQQHHAPSHLSQSMNQQIHTEAHTKATYHAQQQQQTTSQSHFIGHPR